MGRAILSIVCGYAVCALVVAVGLAASAASLGLDGMFEPGTWIQRPSFMALAVGGSVVGALVGGLVSRAISRSARITQGLALLVLALGAIMSAGELLTAAPPQEPRAPNLTFADAMDVMKKNARHPLWFLIVNPLIGAAGVLLGSSLCAMLFLRTRGAGDGPPSHAAT